MKLLKDIWEKIMEDLELFLSNNRLLTIGNLKFEKKLGEGGQGTICCYSKPNGEKVAIKFLIYPKNPDEIKKFYEEVKALNRCKNFKPTFDTTITNQSEVQKVPDLPIYYFLLDIAPGKSLKEIIEKDKIPPWKWSDALIMISRIADALSHAHCAGFVHRDLHPGNIFVDDSFCTLDEDYDNGHPGIYILDFGSQADYFSKILQISDNTETEFRPVGSVKYASPEQLNNPQSVTLSSDMWSIGELLYLLLSGKHPFYGANLRELMEIKDKGKYDEPPILCDSDEEKRFTLKVLSFLLNTDTNQRYTIKQLTKVIYDALYCNVIPILAQDPQLWDSYFLNGGDIWICPHCQSLVHPNGIICPICGMMDYEWIPWLKEK